MKEHTTVASSLSQNPAEEDGTGKADTYKADAEEDGTGRGSEGRGQSNFELAANFGYSSRGSADPRESLRKRRISKLALTAHKVLLAGECFRRGLVFQCGKKKARQVLCFGENR